MNYIWRGYENSKDITNANKQTLTEGSLNVVINDNEKIVPRGGSRHFPWNIFSQVNEDETGVKGAFEYFFDARGNQIPVRISSNGLDDDMYVYRADITGTDEWVFVGKVNQGIAKNQKYTFATWFDKDTDRNYLVFVNGTGQINMWTGANVDGVTSTSPGTLTIPSGTWNDYGFHQNEVLSIVINGNYYFITSPNTLNTNTVTVSPDPFGIVNNDVAFNAIVGITPPGEFRFDYCSQLYNQIYYGDFSKRRLLISNDKNQEASIGLPIFSNADLNSAGLDDATFSGTYTGSTNSVFKVVVSKAGQDTYTFTSQSTGIDDTQIDTSLYSGGDSVFRVVINGTNLEIYKDNLLTSSSPLFLGVNTVNLDGATLTFDASSHVVGDTWTVTLFTGDRVNIYKDDVLIGQDVLIPNPIVPTPIFISDGISVEFFNNRGHAIGDTWIVKAKREITRAYANFYYDTPGREPGQGFEVLLDSPFFTMHPQEKDMYVYCVAGHQYKIYPLLSSNLTNETIKVETLKLDPENIPQDSWLIGVFKNNLATITRDRTIEIIGRQILTELPQIKVMSDDIKKDLRRFDWRDGCIKYIKRNLIISLPRENLVFIWNDARKHWQPPQRFARRIGLISEIDNKIIGHDFDTRNSYEIFVEGEFNDLPTLPEPLGIPIQKRIVLPYNNRGERMKLKKSYMIGFEGYMVGSPQVNYQINFDINGCVSPIVNIINPTICFSDKASLGKANLGYHGLGNDVDQSMRKFRDIYEFPEKVYFESNIELSSNGVSEYWEILGIGMNELNAKLNNACITSNKVTTI